MLSNINQIKKILDELLRLQTCNKEHLDAGRSQNIRQWQEERQRIFLHVKKSFEIFNSQQKKRGDGHYLQLLQEKLAKVLAGEQMLAVAVVERRHGIKEELARMRQGKRCLNGYRVGMVSSSRFLNSRT